MTFDQATKLANKLTKQFGRYYTAIRHGSKWETSQKYDPRSKQ